MPPPTLLKNEAEQANSLACSRLNRAGPRHSLRSRGRLSSASPWGDVASNAAHERSRASQLFGSLPSHCWSGEQQCNCGPDISPATRGARGVQAGASQTVGLPCSAQLQPRSRHPPHGLAELARFRREQAKLLACSFSAFTHSQRSGRSGCARRFASQTLLVQLRPGHLSSRSQRSRRSGCARRFASQTLAFTPSQPGRIRAPPASTGRR